MQKPYSSNLSREKKNQTSLLMKSTKLNTQVIEKNRYWARFSVKKKP